MAKPISKPNWIPSNDPAKITAPDTDKQNTGWLSAEKPAFQYFNWFWNLISKWISFLAGNAEYNAVISDDTTEADYTTLAGYIADSPASGDRVLIKSDQTITSKLTIPAGIKLKLLKGKKFTCSANLTTVIEFGNDIATEGDLLLETSHTGTITEAFVFNGNNNNHQNLVVKNISSGTITSAFSIRSSKTGNLVNGEVMVTAGTITNKIVDVSGALSNQVTIRDTITGIGIIRTASPWPIVSGGTGANTEAAALQNLGLTATAAEVNQVCDNCTATAAQISATAHDGKYSAKGMILGDATAGRVLRAINVLITGQDGSTKIRVSTGDKFNSNQITQESDLTKGGSTTSFSLYATGAVLTVKNSALTGDVIAPLASSIVLNDTGIHALAVTSASGGLELTFSVAPTGAALDLTTLAVGKSVSVDVLYLTNE